MDMPRHPAFAHGRRRTLRHAVSRHGWRHVARRIRGEIGRDKVSLAAAGVAFYGFLSLYPALIALVLLYGILFNVADVEAQLAPYRWMLPPSVYNLIAIQLSSIAAKSGASLSLGFVVSLVLAFWSTTKGVKALVTAVNVAYDEEVGRGIVINNLLALGLTIAAIVFALLSLALVAAIPAAVSLLPVPPAVASLLLWARWLVLALLVMTVLATVYHIGPNRRPTTLHWVLPGAIVACVLWLAASVAFSFYVQHFGSYDRTFGSVSAVVVLLMWLYISAFVFIVGAEVNCALERSFEAAEER